MSQGFRFAAFLSVVLGVWTLMHAYVVARVLSLPWASPAPVRRWVFAGAAFLWALYPAGRILARLAPSAAATVLEFTGAVWMGTLFLLLSALLAADVLTGFGFFFRQAVPWVRGCALAVAGILSIVALVQGLRAPAVVTYEAALAGLPKALDGTRVVQLSDLHLGTLLRHRWLEGVIGQVNDLKPDLVVVSGDLVDGYLPDVEPLVPLLRNLEAPLGVWAVAGNHEVYAGLQGSVRLMESAGFRVLRDASAEAAPGLVLAGVDDLTARRQFGQKGDPVGAALAGIPEGAVIYLSHSPLQAEEAASLGAGLMLSGHTHDGQIWPFGLLVRMAYPRLAGRMIVGSMVLVVSRGTGTWGPPMRLFRRGEIGLITLRSLSDQTLVR